MLGVFLNCSSPFFSERDLSLNLELADWLVCLASNLKRPPVSASPVLREQLPCTLCFILVLGIQTQILMLTQQRRHLLSHHLRPNYLFLDILLFKLN